MNNPPKSASKEDRIIVMGNTEYPKSIVALSKYVAKNFSSICYVSVNMPHSSLIDTLKEKKINHKGFFVIDLISQLVSTEPLKQSPDCIYVNSPNDPNEIGSAIDKAFKIKKFDVFDLFSLVKSLLIYVLSFLQ